MKDYTNNAEEAMVFIKNYDIIEDKIVCHLASKEDYVVPYNDYNLMVIRGIMERQIANEDYINALTKKEVFNGLIAAGLFTGAFVSIIALKNVDYGNYIAVAMALTGAAMAIKNSFTKEKVKDYCKNQFFMDNKDVINAHIKDNENILSKVSNGTKNLVKNTPDGEYVFDINNLDHVKYEDLMQILNNIHRDQAFNFNYENDNSSDKGYTRVRKK